MMRHLLLAGSLLLAATPGLALDAGEVPGYQASVDLTNRAALQRGAKYFVNYCLGCHSLRFSRYERVGKDLGLTDDMVRDNLLFSDQRIGETMDIALNSDDAEAWFGAPPPDLSVIARQKGELYIYQYLMTFYADDSRPSGVNNWRFPNTAMPHVLWQEQGIKQAVWTEHTDDGMTRRTIERLELGVPGQKSEQEFAQMMLDLTSFLVYVAEPAQLVRETIGVWVLLFLLVLIGLTLFLKLEYWKDVH